MCWISDKLEPLSSEEKVPVYKILRDCYTNILEAYFRGTIYALNKEYEEELGITREGVFTNHIIDEGIHCYSDLCKFKRTLGGIIVLVNDKHFRYYAEGQISFTNIYYKAVLVKGYIPPHSTYYVNKQQEIVTSKIVLTDVLDI